MQSNSNEAWRDVPNTKGQYQATESGMVRSVSIGKRTGRQRGRILSPTASRKGYRCFRICVEGEAPRNVKLHRVIMETFIGPCPAGMQVNHKDGDKTNNTVENLEYVTCKENIRHCWSTGLHGTEHCRGARNNKSKLSEGDVREIRRLSENTSQKQLALMFHVTATTICSIQKRRMWKHI